MMLVNQVKGKAPISRTGWTSLGINPKLGVVGTVMMIWVIYHSRSTSPMGGLLRLLPRSDTAITYFPPEKVTTSHLSPREGATMVMPPRIQTIPQVRGSMGSHQDLPAATHMSVSMEISWMHMLVILLFLAIDCLVWMNSDVDSYPSSYVLPLRLYIYLLLCFIWMNW